MKNGLLRRLVCTLLIASPLWWANGCVSEIMKPGDSGENEIEVVTKGDSTYTFLQWASDESGAITGTSGWVKHKDPYFGWTTTHLEKPVAIQADSIKSMRKSDSTFLGTATLRILDCAAVILVVYLFKKAIPHASSGIGPL